MTGFGRIPDPPDPRDHLYRQMVQPTAIPRPATRRASYLGPILDQGPTPHCVAYAATGARNRHERIEQGSFVFGSHAGSYQPGANPSAEWLYAECKKIDGYPGDGTNARAALTVMAGKGLRGPGTTSNQYYKIGQYARLQTIDEILEAIYLHGPVLLGMDVDSNWRQPTGGRIGQPNNMIIGGHEIEAVGYRDQTTLPERDRGLWIKNSWGASWGASGYARLPFTHLDAYPGWDAWWVEDTPNM